MNIYDAIMKAADQIENKPLSFDYCSVAVGGCRTPGCAVGWVAAFMGKPEGEDWCDYDCKQFVGVEYLVFENRMEAIERLWRDSAARCANAMRTYAVKYHAPAKVVQPPDWNAIAARQTVGEHEKSQELA